MPTYSTKDIWAKSNSDYLADVRQDRLRHMVLSLTGAGAYNLFEITGVVLVNRIYGQVTTPIAADTTGAYLNLFPVAGAAVDITAAAGVDISAAVVNTLLAKTAVNTVALTLADATLGFVADVAGPVFDPFLAGQKTGGVQTFIRLTVAGTGIVGAIHWFADWQPVSANGQLVPV